MTKFLQKSFSVYANYAYVPKCEQCGQESIVFFQSVEGKVCQNCYNENKLKRLQRKLEQ
jgi:hypothetical protein